MVILGVAIAGPLGVLALAVAAFSIVTLGPSFQTCETDCLGEGDLAFVALVVGILVFYVLLLVQMVRGVIAALNFGGLLGLFMAVVGFGWVAAAGTRTAAFDVVYLLAVAAGGLALALGALLRLLARREPHPAKPSGP